MLVWFHLHCIDFGDMTQLPQIIFIACLNNLNGNAAIFNSAYPYILHITHFRGLLYYMQETEDEHITSLQKKFITSISR